MKCSFPFQRLSRQVQKTEIVRNIKRHAENSRKSQRFMRHVFQKTVPFGRSRNIGLSSKRRGRVFIESKDGFLIPYVQIQLTDKLLPIKEIVVAPKNHIDLAKKGMEYMIAEKGYDAQVSLSNINLQILREKDSCDRWLVSTCSDAEK